MKQHSWIDYSEAPLYTQTYPAEAPWEEIVAFRAAVSDLVTSLSTPYAWVVDLGRGLGASADAKARRFFADEDARLAPINRKLCAGIALYVPNAVTRGLATAVYWLSPPVFPYRFFSKLDEARKWAREQLEKRGVGGA